MITSFIKRVQRRLNLGVLLHSLLWALLLVALILLVIGLSYIIKDQIVPHSLYLIGLPSTLLATIIVFFIRRKSAAQATSIADSHFKLKNSIATAQQFSQSKEPIHLLQRKQTTTLIQPLDPKSIPISQPRKLLGGTILAMIAASSIAFIPPSEHALLQQKERQLTSQRTLEIKEKLEKNLEEWIQSLSEEEKKALDPDQLRKWVKQLKQTDDKREALRNYARLEQKIQKSIDALDQRKDEEMLKKAGKKLEETIKADTKEIGKKLKNKEFKDAAEKLKNFKLSKQDKQKDPKKAKTKKLNKEQIAKMRNKLNKLRQLSRPLSQAAKSRASQSGANGQNSQGASGQSSSSDPSEAEQELSDMLKELDSDAESLEEWLDEQELQLERGELSEDFQDYEDMEFMESELDEHLENLRGRLGRMSARSKARRRLRSLSQNLSKAQAYANGQCQVLGLAPGGKKPGTGSSDSRRKEKDKLTDNGLYDRLKGQKGKGQSLKSLEEADSGTGTSRRKGKITKKSFERQLNAFIARDDIPEEMKNGVKEYLKEVHQSQPTTPQPSK